MAIVKYENELFHAYGRFPDVQRIGTYFKKKAVRFGLNIQEGGFLPYVMDVPLNRIELVKEYNPFMYQMKYRDRFFHVEPRERENEVELVSGYNLPDYGLKLKGNPRDLFPYSKWVSRSEVIPVT